MQRTLLLCTVVVSAHGQSSVAVYEFTAESHWTEATHPTAIAALARFSPLIGMVHSGDVGFWSPGELASPGIQLMAEVGDFTPLQQEADGYVADGTARETIVGTPLGGTSTFVREVSLTGEHPLFTMVTMIAPSPDWFVGTHGLSLQDDSGEWIETLEVPLDAYDSGTDSGPTFEAPNAETIPPLPVANIQGVFPFEGSPPLATFRFRLLRVEICHADTNADGRLTPADFIAWVVAFNTQSEACEQNGDGRCTPSDFNAWILNFNADC